jgi:hypothetical protein
MPASAVRRSIPSSALYTPSFTFSPPPLPPSTTVGVLQGVESTIHVLTGTPLSSLRGAFRVLGRFGHFRIRRDRPPTASVPLLPVPLPTRPTCHRNRDPYLHIPYTFLVLSRMKNSSRDLSFSPSLATVACRPNGLLYCTSFCGVSPPRPINHAPP